MKVLVTGGAGYVGSFCVRHLLAADHGVVVLDRRPVRPAGDRASVPSVVGDIADGPLVQRILQTHGVEVVLHLAADKSVAESMAAPGPHLRNNVSGSLALFEAMLERGVGKIVFSSSAAVYGTPTRLPVDERAPLAPDNPYGASKVMVEQMLHWYHVCHGFDTVSLRYFNAAGAADDGSLGEEEAEASNLVPRVMQALAGTGEPLSVYGTDFATPDGTAVRDYVHVEDLALAHVRALELVGQGRGAWTFNLGTGRGHSVREVLHAAERASGRPVPHQETARRPGDPAQVWADASAAARELGWRAERDLDDIVRSAWSWRQRHD
ncbi:MAG: UDP-glucose 4-epimerase GalE [Chloroflexota bacterium]|nr:UDP-glucose 4-epimerase GalE [Chloroflexota bacterium]